MATNPNLLTNPFGLQPATPPPPTPPIESGLLPPTQPVQAPAAPQPAQAPAPQPSQPQAPAPQPTPTQTPAPAPTQATPAPTPATPTPAPTAQAQSFSIPSINWPSFEEFISDPAYQSGIGGSKYGSFFDEMGQDGYSIRSRMKAFPSEAKLNYETAKRQIQTQLDRARDEVFNAMNSGAAQDPNSANSKNAKHYLENARNILSKLSPQLTGGVVVPTFEQLIGQPMKDPQGGNTVTSSGSIIPPPAPETPSPASPTASTIPFKAGLSDAQKASITTLSKKDPTTWTLTDKANWNYATNSAPLPNQASSSGGAAPGATPAAPTSQTSSAAPSPNAQTSAIPFKDGLSDAQKQSITNLSKKPLDQWTSTDKANWAYATNGAPLPSGGTAASGPVPGSSSPSGTAPGASGGATEQPIEDFDAQFKALFDAYQKAQLAGPSTEEVGTQSALDKIIQEQANLEQAKRLGLQSASEQPIELGFITGQQANIERRATNLMTGLTAQEIPLKQRLAAEQAKRQAALDVADKQFELEKSRLEKREAAAEAQRLAKIKADAIKTLSPGQSLVDPDTGEVLYTAPGKASSTPTKTFVKATKYQPAGWVDTATGEFTPETAVPTPKTGSSGGSSSGSGTPTPSGLKGSYSPAEKRELSRLGIADDATAGLYLTSEPAFQTWFGTQARTAGASPSYNEVNAAKSYWTANVKNKTTAGESLF